MSKSLAIKNSLVIFFGALISFVILMNIGNATASTKQASTFTKNSAAVATLVSTKSVTTASTTFVSMVSPTPVIAGGWGQPAIQSHENNAASPNLALNTKVAGFTEADVRQFVQNYSKDSSSKAAEPIVVDKVELVTASQILAWEKATYGSYTSRGEPADMLECLVLTHGTFVVAAPPSPESVSKARVFTKGYMIFDAQTGNLIASGAYK